jgi:acyl carrier protein
LIVAVEEYFDIEFEDDYLDIAVLSTLEDIKNQVEKYKANSQ